MGKSEATNVIFLINKFKQILTVPSHRSAYIAVFVFIYIIGIVVVRIDTSTVPILISVNFFN